MVLPFVFAAGRALRKVILMSPVQPVEGGGFREQQAGAGPSMGPHLHLHLHSAATRPPEASTSQPLPWWHDLRGAATHSHSSQTEGGYHGASTTVQVRDTRHMAGFYTCLLAASDHVNGFEHWDNDLTLTRELISDPIHTAKTLEAASLIAHAILFYDGATRQFCTAKGKDAQFECSGHAVLCKFKAV
ncbi:hypothetical protein B0H10DRAFT_1949210 [Mycena sp. CBHHK59/15]|nr:hypothetical protein B0H10DRAFT_1949210 [Mycena sp. CBHHK59/15]